VKDFELKHPYIASLIVFLTVFGGGTLIGFIFGLLIGEFDNGMMIPLLVWCLAFMGSLILGIVAGIATLIILFIAIDKKEKQPFK
jgi:hypothetical protein